MLIEFAKHVAYHHVTVIDMHVDVCRDMAVELPKRRDLPVGGGLGWQNVVLYKPRGMDSTGSQPDVVLPSPGQASNPREQLPLYLGDVLGPCRCLHA